MGVREIPGSKLAGPLSVRPSILSYVGAGSSQPYMYYFLGTLYRAATEQASLSPERRAQQADF